MTVDDKRAEFREHAKTLREIAGDKDIDLTEQERKVLLNLALGYEALADGRPRPREP
jgi:hypothetical protein